MRYFIFLLIFQLSCTSQNLAINNISVDGIYYSKDEGYIHLDKNKYEFIRLSGPYHIKTFTGFSKGEFKLLQKNILSLNSDRKVNSFGNVVWDIKVNETVNKSNENNKRVTFYIDNLTFFLKELKTTDVTILLEYFDENGDIIKKTILTESNNSLSFPNTSDEFSPIGFTIEIISRYRIYPDINDRYFIYYGANNGKSNYFQITLPILSKDDFNYLIFKDELMRIEENKIYWNGETYIKND